MSDEGIEKIISHIRAEAEKEIAEVLQRAETEAESIKKSAQDRAEQEAGRILANGKRATSLEGQRMLAETRIDLRRKRMDVQEEAIDGCFAEAKKILDVLAEKGNHDKFVYRDILVSLVSSGAEVMAGDKLELVFNLRDKKAFDKRAVEELTGLVRKRTGRNISLVLANESMQCLGGVIVRDLEHAVEVDNTLETKLNRLKESVRVDVAKILFGDRL